MPERYVGELRVLERINSYEFAFEADILRTGPVQGGRWEFANLEQNYKSFAGRPVLIAYVGRRVGDGHNGAERIDRETGERYRSFTDATAERIIGMISEQESDLTLYERDGYTWLRVKGRIWTYYAKEAVDEIVRTGRMDVSIEAEVHDMREEDGREVYDTWIGLGLTILGVGVDPAVPGANIRALADMQQEFEEMKLRVASLVEEEKKPQNNDDKGVKKRMRLSKKQIRELQAKFEGYTVLAAEQGESGVVVCLMSKAGQTAIYQMASLDETVYPEKVLSVNAQTHFCADGCDDVLVDACDMVETMTTECTELTARLSAAETARDEALATVDRMVNAENARRLSAAKEMATATLNSFNANRDNKIDAKVLEALNKDIEAGKYTACADENGNWTGDALVAKEVKALCADAVMEQDKKNAAHEPLTWGNVKRASTAPGTIGDRLAHKN